MKPMAKMGLVLLGIVLALLIVGWWTENRLGAARLDEAIARAESLGIEMNPRAWEERAPEEGENFFDAAVLAPLQDFEFEGPLLEETLDYRFDDPVGVADLRERDVPSELYVKYSAPRYIPDFFETGRGIDTDIWAAAFRLSPDFETGEEESDAKDCLDALDAKHGPFFTALAEAAEREESILQAGWNEDGFLYPGYGTPSTVIVDQIGRLLVFRFVLANEIGDRNRARETLALLVQVIDGLLRSRESFGLLLGATQCEFLVSAIGHSVASGGLSAADLECYRHTLRNLRLRERIVDGVELQLSLVPGKWSHLERKKDLFETYYDYISHVPGRSGVPRELFRFSPKGLILRNAAREIDWVIDEIFLPWNGYDFSSLPSVPSRIPSRDGPDSIFLDGTLVSWFGGGDRYVSILVRKALVETACGIEGYRLDRGSDPETLAALVPEFLESVPVDPFDGNEMRYRRDGDSYLLYSIGWDLDDDGGEVVRRNSRQIDRTQGDWVIPPEKIESENIERMRAEALQVLAWEAEHGGFLSEEEIRQRWEKVNRREIKTPEMDAAKTEQERRRQEIIRREYEKLRQQAAEKAN